jgi:hypothetical protein
MGSNVTLQYYGDMYNECSKVAVLLNKNVKNGIAFRCVH